MEAMSGAYRIARGQAQKALIISFVFIVVFLATAVALVVSAAKSHQEIEPLHSRQTLPARAA